MTRRCRRQPARSRPLTLQAAARVGSRVQREWKIRSTLRALARQRVVTILQPGNHWVVEKALSRDDGTEAALRTCFMRGWVEPVEGAVPESPLPPRDALLRDGEPAPSFTLVHRSVTIYRLTEGGWAVINRSHQLVILSVFLAIVALFA